jgi:CO/xanthine dehydrogenase FAD-binding subunit
VEILSPTTLDDALELRARHPEALPILGGTDVMVDLNFERVRPDALLDLGEVPELRGWSAESGSVLLGAGVTYTELLEPMLAAELPALAEAARTVGSPQIRNRGTIGGNLGTASPAGDALPPLLVYGAEVELASVGGSRTLPLEDFLLGPKRTALVHGELITGVRIPRRPRRETFMKVGPRNAMVIAVCSLGLAVDEEHGEVRAAFGSAAQVATLVRVPLARAASLPEGVAAAASPIDDVRGSAAYRRHALRVLAKRALERCLA